MIFGKIHHINREYRLLSIIINKRLAYFHITHKMMKDFKSYFYQLPYVQFQPEKNYMIINGVRAREVACFHKIMIPSVYQYKTFYDINHIRKAVKQLLDKPTYKLFLDLEFTMPSSIKPKASEIVQYGMILEDDKGQVILESSALVNPLYSKALNNKTLKFLSREAKDFNQAVSYIAFYQLLEQIIRDYDAKIVAWGRNDILALERSFKTNHLRPLDIRNRYMNLMQIIKNYYSFRQEKGLFPMYQELTNKEAKVQIHDALEDAKIAREIYYLFKEKMIQDLGDI
ncbi:MAG: exonuclease domain-containing protein [Bacilli bacterium]|nr:exonuclease domain-containing protein [Bacilli bacterium]